MPVIPSRETIARELYIMDHVKRKKAARRWDAGQAKHARRYWSVADKVLQIIADTQPPKGKARGGAIPGGFTPAPAESIQVMLSPGGPASLQGMPDLPTQFAIKFNDRKRKTQ